MPLSAQGAWPEAQGESDYASIIAKGQAEARRISADAEAYYNSTVARSLTSVWPSSTYPAPNAGGGSKTGVIIAVLVVLILVAGAVAFALHR